MTLDRMMVEEVGANPVRLAAAIHLQLGDRTGPIPVKAIALALDIVEIKVEPLRNFEGALITTADRNTGSILINAKSSHRRRRFTIGHELLHFLNVAHAPGSSDGFCCSKQDMIANQGDSQNRHIRQETEANAFAIELLTPRRRLRPYLLTDLDLSQVVSMSEDFDISRAAAARRYVSCHAETAAAVFGKNGRFLYYMGKPRFPSLRVRKESLLPGLPAARNADGISSTEEAESDDWLFQPNGASISVQTLHQRDGHSITLLRVIPGLDEDSGDDGVEDVYERFSRFGRR